MQLVTSKIVADKLAAYLHHEMQIGELVSWAEDVMMEGDFEEGNFENIREIVSRLGVSDVKAFGLAWEDCEYFLNKLGYVVKVEIAVN